MSHGDGPWSIFSFHYCKSAGIGEAYIAVFCNPPRRNTSPPFLAEGAFSWRVNTITSMLEGNQRKGKLVRIGI